MRSNENNLFYYTRVVLFWNSFDHISPSLLSQVVNYGLQHSVKHLKVAGLLL